MSELTDEFVSLALELITEFGTSIVITYTPPGVRDPATGKTPPGVPTTQTPKCLIEDKGIWLGAEEGVKGEKKLTIAGSGFTRPASGSTFVVEGQTFTVFDKGVKAYYSEATAVLYEVYGTLGRG